ncbi:MAG: hypothetical protein AB1758_36025 [Candidatus Eremiobacterota bacterium]
MLPPDFPTQLQPAFEKLLSQGEARTVEELRMGIRVHLSRVAQAARGGSFDPRIAEGIGNGLLALLDLKLEEPKAGWVLAAISYFVDSYDEEPDFESPDGFVDDAQVFNAVARAVGKPNLEVKL